MGKLLVVDGSGVCRAPVVAFTVGDALTASGRPIEADVVARGLAAETGRTMCESAAVRLGWTGPAIAYFGAYRAIRLSVADVAAADLVLTAERTQRSTVVRMLPGSQARVFTWKEAGALVGLAAARRNVDGTPPPTDLAGIARALHGVRGAVQLAEPATRTGPFHWRRAAGSDPLTTASGHAPAADHRRATQESRSVALAFAADLLALVDDAPRPVAQAGRARLLRRPA